MEFLSTAKDELDGTRIELASGLGRNACSSKLLLARWKNNICANWKCFCFYFEKHDYFYKVCLNIFLSIPYKFETEYL